MYTGHKKIPGVFQKIINEVPAHTHYLEPFGGTGIIGKLLPVTTVKHFNDLNKNLHICYRRIPGDTVIVTKQNAIDILQSGPYSSAGTDTFIFCDPPYLHCTRAQPNLYKYEMTDTDHIQFLAAVKLLHCKIMIVHPRCELYDNALQSWRTIELKIRYNRKTSHEKLYMNYLPGSLQTYRYIGKDCWQRQAYKRKSVRHSRKSIPIPFEESRYLTDNLSGAR